MADDGSNSMLSGPSEFSRKRRPKRGGNGGKLGKRKKPMPQYQGKAAAAKVGDGKKGRRLIRKRVREYNSDDEEDNDGDERGLNERKLNQEEGSGGEEERNESSESDDEKEEDKMEGSDDDNGEMQQGITKFTEGCRAFRMAFTKIMKKSSSSDPLGPILSAHKKLVAEKLAGELAEEKVKVEAKKAKHLIGEKGHVQPANFLDSKDKFLINVATKGVVKLFNAVNRAQKSQQGLNPAKSKDAKVMAKRRKEAFLSELRKPSTQAGSNFFEASKAKNKDEESNDEPGWAPLQDGYMLTKPKLKDWDKMPDPSSVSDTNKTPLESSSDED